MGEHLTFPLPSNSQQQKPGTIPNLTVKKINPVRNITLYCVRQSYLSICIVEFYLPFPILLPVSRLPNFLLVSLSNTLRHLFLHSLLHIPSTVYQRKLAHSLILDCSVMCLCDNKEMFCLWLTQYKEVWKVMT